MEARKQTQTTEFLTIDDVLFRSDGLLNFTDEQKKKFTELCQQNMEEFRSAIDLLREEYKAYGRYDDFLKTNEKELKLRAHEFNLQIASYEIVVRSNLKKISKRANEQHESVQEDISLSDQEYSCAYSATIANLKFIQENIEKNLQEIKSLSQAMSDEMNHFGFEKVLNRLEFCTEIFFKLSLSDLTTVEDLVDYSKIANHLGDFWFDKNNEKNKKPSFDNLCNALALAYMSNSSEGTIRECYEKIYNSELSNDTSIKIEFEDFSFENFANKSPVLFIRLYEYLLDNFFGRQINTLIEQKHKYVCGNFGLHQLSAASAYAHCSKLPDNKESETHELNAVRCKVQALENLMLSSKGKIRKVNVEIEKILKEENLGCRISQKILAALSCSENLTLRKNVYTEIIKSLNEKSSTFILDLLKKCYVDGLFLPADYANIGAMINQIILYFYPHFVPGYDYLVTEKFLNDLTQHVTMFSDEVYKKLESLAAQNYSAPKNFLRNNSYKKRPELVPSSDFNSVEKNNSDKETNSDSNTASNSGTGSETNSSSKSTSCTGTSSGTSEETDSKEETNSSSKSTSYSGTSSGSFDETGTEEETNLNSKSTSYSGTTSDSFDETGSEEETNSSSKSTSYSGTSSEQFSDSATTSNSDEEKNSDSNTTSYSGISSEQFSNSATTSNSNEETNSNSNTTSHSGTTSCSGEETDSYEETKSDSKTTSLSGTTSGSDEETNSDSKTTSLSDDEVNPSLRLVKQDELVGSPVQKSEQQKELEKRTPLQLTQYQGKLFSLSPSQLRKSNGNDAQANKGNAVDPDAGSQSQFRRSGK